MHRSLTPPIRELIRAIERVIEFASAHKGLPEDDCEAGLFYTHELIGNIKEYCVQRSHKHDGLLKEVAEMASNFQSLEICCNCQNVHDDRETAYERWIPKQTYREEIGIDPTDCALTPTYCPECYKHVVTAMKVA